MSSLFKWAARIAAALVGLVVLAVAVVLIVSSSIIGRKHEAKAEPLPAVPAALLADAPRQARILGCISCHGEGLRGKTMVDVPNVVRVHAPNIPAIAARASDQQLAAAIRQGIGHDGRGLFVMPSPMYSRMSEAEVAALIAWIRTLPVHNGGTGTVTARPLGRLGVAIGRFRPAPAKMEEFQTQVPLPTGDALAAGRRLAANACSECHGPALFGMSMEGSDVVTPDLRIAAGYDYEQFRTLMRTGETPSGKKLGLMATVAKQDFSHFTDAEIASLHGYLRSRAEKLPASD